MSLVTPGTGQTFTYAGRSAEVLSADGPWSACELQVPAGFAGPVPHAHDGFDEGLFVLSGVLLAGLDDDPAREAGPGSLLTVPRGRRHFFSNPFDEPAQVLGLWTPAELGLAFMRDVGAVLGGPREEVEAVYAAHASRLLP